jgi:glycosyltransferase involved in cell wall biosynthesis
METADPFITVCWYKVYPPVSGGQNGIVYFNEALAENAPVIFICSKNNEKPDQSRVEMVPVLGTSKSQFFIWGNYKKILNLIRAHQAKRVLIENPYYCLLVLFKKKYQFRWFVHTHNIEFQRARENGKWFWPFIKCCEAIAYRNADRIICKTASDRDSIQKVFKVTPDKILVMPYCTNLKEIPPGKSGYRKQMETEYAIPSTCRLLLFAASFDYIPNQQGLLHLYHDIFPLLLEEQGFSFKIVLCGKGLEEFLKNNKIILPEQFIVAGFVPELQPYFMAADLFINPVRNGQGMQTKNIDAIAHNCMVAGYASVANGMPDGLCNKKLFLAEEPTTTAMLKTIRKALTHNNDDTPDAFYREFNWGNHLEQVLKQF